MVVRMDSRCTKKTVFWNKTSDVAQQRNQQSLTFIIRIEAMILFVQFNHSNRVYGVKIKWMVIW